MRVPFVTVRNRWFECLFSVKQPDLDIMSSKKQYCETEQVVVHDKEKGKSEE